MSEKASPEYWDGLWANGAMPELLDMSDTGLNNHVNRTFDGYFARLLADCPAATTRLLEIGCARSVWLPHFARRYGFAVTGLDRSEIGCEQSRAVLAAAGVAGEVVAADLFAPPDHLRGAFDLVFSFGVIEHFTDTAGALAACADYLKPGGRIVTVIPNLCGLPGLLQRYIDREVYDIHVPLSAERLAEAHREAGLMVLGGGYLLSANWCMLVYRRLSRWGLDGFAQRAASAASKLFWLLERADCGLPPNRLTSPYVVCHAVKLSARPA